MWTNPRYVDEETRAGENVPAYSYAGNNPLIYVDPDGLDKTSVFCDDGKSMATFNNGNAPQPGSKGGIPGKTVCDDCNEYNIDADGKCPLGRKTSPLCACRKKLEKEICRQCKEMKKPKPAPACINPESPHPT